ncbi:MAG: hypothetical protein OEZ59_06330 [Deltaproteobacteria bacterium]|nr:hypothetical protein [Deltaproteobacteria bacterium]
MAGEEQISDPRWQTLLKAPPRLAPPAGTRHVHVVADAHLGDPASPAEPFLEMLRELEGPGLCVVLGDLFQVWLALPGFWDAQAGRVLEGLEQLRSRGVRTVLVVGNREFFLPRDKALLQRRGLPFDEVCHDGFLLDWQGRGSLFTHGDIINRADSAYLRWRALSRSAPLEWLFRLLPGRLAQGLAQRLERTIRQTNMSHRLHLPEQDLRDFARLAPADCQAIYAGHFHARGGYGEKGGGARLTLVPDWMGTRTVLRMGPDGAEEWLEFPA